VTDLVAELMDEGAVVSPLRLFGKQKQWWLLLRMMPSFL
jgi:hypothetical protein